MGERRMFSKEIVKSDTFLDMPAEAQALYFHLGMEADDEGFLNRPKSVMRSCSCSEDSLKLLIAKKFILAFESGVVVITHWRINNTLRKDRLNATKCIAERALVDLDESGKYQMTTTCRPNGNQMTTTCQLNGHQVSPQHNITEHNIREYKENHTLGKVTCGNLGNVYLTPEQHDELYRLVPSQADGYIERFGRYKSMKAIESHDDYAWIRGWMDEDEAIAKERQKQEAERWDAIVEEEANAKP